MDDKTLVHWGIKGMKWGVRRYQNSDGSLTPAGKKRYSDSDQQDSAKSLSEAELRQRTNRLRAENDYVRAQRDYAQLHAKQKSAGRKLVEDVLMNSGKQIATSLITSYGTKLATSKIDSWLSGGKDDIGSQIKKMSDDELRKKVSRATLEREYRKHFG